MLKILVFMSQFHKPSGSERLAVELAEGLNRLENVHAEILGMYREDHHDVAEARRRLLSLGIPSVRFLGLEPRPNPASLPGAVWRLRRLIDEEQYDLLETSMIGPSTIASWAGVSLATVFWLSNGT